MAFADDIEKQMNEANELLKTSISLLPDELVDKEQLNKLWNN
jgi:hypothetical protein